MTQGQVVKTFHRQGRLGVETQRRRRQVFPRLTACGMRLERGRGDGGRIQLTLPIQCIAKARSGLGVFIPGEQKEALVDP